MKKIYYCKPYVAEDENISATTFYIRNFIIFLVRLIVFLASMSQVSGKG